MEPVFAVAQEPPRAPRQLGRMVQGGGWRRQARCPLALALFLAVTGDFAFAACRARHGSRGLAFVLVAYLLLALLVCCIAKLERLRRYPRGAERRRWVRIAVWAISAALGNMFASPVADAMPRLALKLVALGVAAVVLGLGFYSLYFSKDDADCCCDAELDRPWPRCQADAGCRPATALHGRAYEIVARFL